MMTGTLAPLIQGNRSSLPAALGHGRRSDLGQDLSQGLDNSRKDDVDWDLSHIRDALYTLSYQSIDNGLAPTTTHNGLADVSPALAGESDLVAAGVASAVAPDQQQSHQLGNFDEIWRYLGEVLMAEIHINPPLSELNSAQLAAKPDSGFQLPLTREVHATTFEDPFVSNNALLQNSLRFPVEANSGVKSYIESVDDILVDQINDSYNLAAPLENSAYTSDGAIYNRPAANGVRFNAHLDESGEDTAQGDQAEDEKKLTRTQRKKLNRRTRKEAEKNQPMSPSNRGSDAELGASGLSPHLTPARKASLHVLSPDVGSPPSVPAAFRSLESFITTKSGKKKKIAEKKIAEKKTPISFSHALSSFSKVQEPLAPSPLESKAKHGKRMGKRNGSNNGIKMEPTRATPPPRGNSASYFDYKANTPSTAHVQPSFAPSSVRLAPPAVTPGDAVTTPQVIITPLGSQTTPGMAYETPGHNVYDDAEATARRSRGPNENPCSPLPRVRQDQPKPENLLCGTNRHVSFWNKLTRDFPDDARWLFAPAQMLNAPGAVHVFVDASNILIGFSERMRVTGLRRQFPKVNLSFDSLVLLMERRRPLAKRVLVGSFDQSGSVVAFDIAKAVGYETNILDKVNKTRELTERQLHFRLQDGRPIYTSMELASGVGSEKGRGPHKTPTSDKYGRAPSPVKLPGSKGPFYAPATNCEQGVDEILHMKMLESMVDFSTAPATMVLATGDAAAAEYSDGFLKNVERALERGWKVELVSWTKGISSAYRRRDFLARWGNQFRIIYLDDYLYDLMDV